MRASLYIEGAGGECIVIDTGPEFRLQAVRAGITRLDGILLTHAHADHVHGLDDIRPLSKEGPIPVFGNADTIEEIQERFSYAFKETQRGGGKPRIELRPVSEPFRIGRLTCIPVPIQHGSLVILGWRIDEEKPESKGAVSSLVYLTDASFVPQPSRGLIQKPNALIIGGLRARPHETHFNFEQALGAALETGAQNVFLTHICHEHSHVEIEGYCNNFLSARGIKGIFAGPA
jgi:phosphoribosyl 1,2-cyclic phosphate phosphodiesterase